MGAGNIKLVGTYIHRGIFFVSIAFVLVSIILLLVAETLFEISNQDKEVALKSMIYIRYMLPFLYFQALFDSYKKLLVNYNRQKVAIII